MANHTRVENTLGKPSSACFFHCAICVGCTPYSEAISFAVLCPLMASKATFVFSSVLYRLRCPAIDFSFFCFSQYSYFILSTCPGNWDHYKEAIKQQFLIGYSETDCFVKATPYGHPREDESFQTAVIDIPRHSAQTRMQLNALVAKCPKYVTFNGVSYFMMDPKHPNKLLFIRLGQDNISSGVWGKGTWDDTIKVLQ